MTRFAKVFGIFFVSLALIVVAAVFLFQRHDKERVLVRVSGQSYWVAVADTPIEHLQGLSDLDTPPGDGMLFVFNEPQAQVSFWMKGMRFPLDIIWIRHGHVIGVERDVPIPDPSGEIPSRTAPEQITHVLELPAGEADSIAVGDTVAIDY